MGFVTGFYLNFKADRYSAEMGQDFPYSNPTYLNSQNPVAKAGIYGFCDRILSEF